MPPSLVLLCFAVGIRTWLPSKDGLVEAATAKILNNTQKEPLLSYFLRGVVGVVCAPGERDQCIVAKGFVSASPNCTATSPSRRRPAASESAPVRSNSKTSGTMATRASIKLLTKDSKSEANKAAAIANIDFARKK